MAWRSEDKRTQHNTRSRTELLTLHERGRPWWGRASHAKDFLRIRKRRTESAAGKQKAFGGQNKNHGPKPYHQEPWYQQGTFLRAVCARRGGKTP